MPAIVPDLEPKTAIGRAVAQHELPVGGKTVATIQAPMASVSNLSPGERFALYDLLAALNRRLPKAQRLSLQEAEMVRKVLFHDGPGGCFVGQRRLRTETFGGCNSTKTRALESVIEKGFVVSIRPRDRRKAARLRVALPADLVDQATRYFDKPGGKVRVLGSQHTTRAGKSAHDACWEVSTEPRTDLEQNHHHRNALPTWTPEAWHGLERACRAVVVAAFLDWADHTLTSKGAHTLNTAWRTFAGRKASDAPICKDIAPKWTDHPAVRMARESDAEATAEAKAARAKTEARLQSRAQDHAVCAEAFRLNAPYEVHRNAARARAWLAEQRTAAA